MEAIEAFSASASRQRIAAPAAAEASTSSSSAPAAAASSSTSRIRSVDNKTVQRICSDQVIVDLPSALKELLENALDAGATRLDIRLKEHGVELLEVADNGKGIAAADLDGVALRHTTSKLGDFDDLQRLASYGFRGEALNSLAALSSLSITTRTKDDAIGTSLAFDTEGAVTSRKRLAADVGTCVSIATLFAPFPVRRRELQRNGASEFRKLVSMLQAYALICAEVRINCTHTLAKGGKNVLLQTPGGTGGLRASIAAVFGAKLLAELTPISGKSDEDDRFEVNGYISRPRAGDGRRAGDRQYLYVNSRPVDFPKLSRLLNEAYRQATARAECFPVAFVDVRAPPDSYDINVTPDKRTVLFAEEGKLLGLVRTILEKLFATESCTLQMQQPMLTFAPAPVNAPSAEPAAPEPEAEPAAVADAKALAEEEKEEEEEEEEAIAPAAAAATEDEEEHDTEPEEDDEEEEVRSLGAAAANLPPPPPPAAEPAAPAALPAARAPAPAESSTAEFSFAAFAASAPVATSSGIKRDSAELSSTAPPPPSKRQLRSQAEEVVVELEEEEEAEAAEEAMEVDDTVEEEERPAAQPPSAEAEEEADDEAAEEETPSMKSLLALLKAAHEECNGPDGRGPIAELQLACATFAQQLGVLGHLPVQRDDATSITSLLAQLAQCAIKYLKGWYNHYGEEVVPLPISQIEVEATLAAAGLGWEEEALLDEESDVKEQSERLADAFAAMGATVTKAVEAKPKDKRRNQRRPAARDDEDDEDDDDYQEEEEEDDDEEEGDGEPSQRPSQNTSSQRSRASAKSSSGGKAALHPNQAHGFPEDLLVSFSLEAARRQLLGGSGPQQEQPAAALVGTEPLGRVPSSPSAGGVRTVPDAGSLDRATRIATSELEAELSRVLPKASFTEMEVLGQFNLGFMIARAQRLQGGGNDDVGASSSLDTGDLYIIDQHAADEKYRFETLRNATEIHTQRLIAPLPLHLTAADELLVIDHMHVFNANGFHITVEANAPPTQRLKLVALPFSKETVFGPSDVHELVTLLAEAPGSMCKLPKLRSMFAMRACRSAVMIGTALDQPKMTSLVRQLATLEQPWNCPHGRPTLRHLVDLKKLAATAAATEFERSRRRGGDGDEPRSPNKLSPLALPNPYGPK